MKGSFFRTLLTEDDANQVWCPMRIAFWVAFALFVVLCLYAYVVKGQSFDPVAFGAGAGGLITGAGAGIFFNGRSSAPKEKSQ
jgi:hypothetical protein